MPDPLHDLGSDAEPSPTELITTGLAALVAFAEKPAAPSYRGLRLNSQLRDRNRPARPIAPLASRSPNILTATLNDAASLFKLEARATSSD